MAHGIKMINSGINSQLLGINQNHTNAFILHIVFLVLEVLSDFILLVHLILCAYGHEVGLIEVSVLIGITMIF